MCIHIYIYRYIYLSIIIHIYIYVEERLRSEIGTAKAWAFRSVEAWKFWCGVARFGVFRRGGTHPMPHATLPLFGTNVFRAHGIRKQERH